MFERISSYDSCDLTFICFPWLGESVIFQYFLIFICGQASKKIAPSTSCFKIIIFKCLEGDVMWRAGVENFSQELENRTGYQ